MSAPVHDDALRAGRAIGEAEWAALRRESLVGLPVDLDPSDPDVLLGYQRRLLETTAAHPVVVVPKSRRIGATWGIGADAALTAGAARDAGGMDVLYIGYNLDMAREFIDVCAMWAVAFAQAATAVGEFLFDDVNPADPADTKAIQAFRIRFASGFEVVALSSRPRSLRGRQGCVILDEAAFHDDLEGLLKAAFALLIWGGKVLVISSHNGEATFGDLVRKEAKAAGLKALVDPVLDRLKLGYRLRWDQSPIDFLNEVADDVGATIKPAGGKLVAMKRGGGTTGGGKALEPIVIRRRRSFGYDVDIEPRPEAGHVAAAWQDEKTGRRRLTKVPTGRDGPIVILPHPYRSEIEAREAAKSQAYERGNNSGSGYFESPGLPRARAEAPVIASGFGGFIDGRWKAESVEKVITVQGAFTTTVNIAAGDEKKGQKGT